MARVRYDQAYVLARIQMERRGHRTRCWIWQRARYRSGYGFVSPRSGHHLAHRLAFALWRGPFPPGLESDHLCGQRECVRPDHLEPVSHRENMHRTQRIAAFLARTHCPAGHAYDSVNTYRSPDRRRHCRTCLRLWTRRYRYPERR